jgi:hypothetical protein
MKLPTRFLWLPMPLRYHETADPLFVAPHAIAVDSKGDLYIGEVSFTESKVDRGFRTIQKFARI